MNKKKSDDFIQNIFEMQEKSDSLDLEDEELVLNENKIALKSKKMYEFIETNLEPDEQEILKKIMTERNDAIFLANSRKNFLCYKNGFLEGMAFVLNAIRYM